MSGMDQKFELLEILYSAGVLSEAGRKMFSEGYRFAGTSLHVGQMLIFQNMLTVDELKFALETIEAVRVGRLTREEAIIAVRDKHKES